MRGGLAPPGYVRFERDGTTVVARAGAADAVAAALHAGSLYDYAAHHPEARPLTGRGVAFAAPLPDDRTWIVVRRSRHGGALAALTGERFLYPTRAPRELSASLRLAREGVPTPEVVAYAVYRAGTLLRRADVATAAVPNAQDLDAALREHPVGERRAELIDAVVDLLRRLGAAGARHPDLNVKNVLIARRDNGGTQAWVIDVDRVWFDTHGARRVSAANFRRLARSALKRHRVHGTPIHDADLAHIARELGLDRTLAR